MPIHALSHPARHLWAAIAFAMGCLLPAACTRAPASAPVPAAFTHDGRRIIVPAGSPLRERLVVVPVELHAAPHWLNVPGIVAADPAHTANVLSPLGGRVASVKVGIGQHVKRGQLLAVLDSGDMAQAYADLGKARDALRLARETLTRAEGVARAGGNAVKDLEAARSGVNQAAAEYRRARARLAALGGRGGAATPHPIEVRAPIGGVVAALSVAAGAYVNDPTAPLMSITDISRVWVVAQVPENDLGLISVGQRARIHVPAWPDRAFPGAVASLDAVLDSDTRRDGVRIAIDNAGHALRPNMFAQVALAVTEPPQVFVPASALLMNNDSTTVFVEVAPWTFERRRIESGYDEGDEARVLAGLKAGDRVVAAGGVLLNDD